MNIEMHKLQEIYNIAVGYRTVRKEYDKFLLISLINKFIDELEKVDFNDITIDGISLKEYFGLLSFEYYKYIKKHEPDHTKFEYILYLIDIFKEKDYSNYLFGIIQIVKSGNY